MSWMGKVVGGTIGFALGGPIGAVAGAAFGHMFDDGSNQNLQFSNDAYLKLKSRYAPDTDKYYTILGCSNSDSDDIIKSQYRKLVRDYHPDTIASKGLPEEFITFANDKFHEIQEAYEMVKKDRNL